MAEATKNAEMAEQLRGEIAEVYQRSGVSNVLNSGRRMVRAGHNAKEIMIPRSPSTGWATALAT